MSEERKEAAELMDYIEWIEIKQEQLDLIELDFIDQMESKGCIGVSLKQENWIIKIFDRIFN